MADNGGGSNPTIPILILFAGYTITSYGIVLLKGYDITLRQWVNPLAGFQWPQGQVPTVP